MKKIKYWIVELPSSRSTTKSVRAFNKGFSFEKFFNSYALSTYYNFKTTLNFPTVEKAQQSFHSQTVG